MPTVNAQVASIGAEGRRCVCTPWWVAPGRWGGRVLELGVLGPGRAVRDGRELELGGRKPRAVLALLLVDASRVVPAEYLAEALWRGAPPPGAAKTLRSYVSRLRSLLDPGAALVAQGGGYAIRIEPDRVDA